MLSTTNAQVRFGIKTGMNRGTINFQNTPSYIVLSSKNGFLIGGIIELPIYGPIFLQLEPCYIGKGYLENSTMVLMKADNNFSVIELPLLIKLKFDCFALKPFLTTGLNANFILSESTRIIDYINGVDQEIGKVNNISNYQSFNLAFNLGGGIEYEISRILSIVSSIHYSTGILNVSKRTNVTGYSEDMQVDVGVMLYLF